MQLYEVTGDDYRVAYIQLTDGQPTSNVVYLRNIDDIDLEYYESLLVN